MLNDAPLLFHGTSERRLAAILAHGLLPRGRRRGNFSATVESNPRAVYLTDAYALHFAYCASRGQTPGVIFEIDAARLNVDRLRADEDVIEQANRGRDDLPRNWDMRRRTRHYRKLAERDDRWRESLAAMGTCQHYGAISPAAIRRYAVIEWSRWPGWMHLHASDRPPNVIAFQVRADELKREIAWLFGAVLDAEQFVDPWSLG